MFRLSWVCLLALCGLICPLRAAEIPALLEQKIEVDFQQCYLSEVLTQLREKHGLQSAFPGTADRFGTFTLAASGIRIKDVLEKLATEQHLELDYHDGIVFVWRPASDALLEELGAKLQSPDRWVRSDAAWNLTHLG